MDQLDKEIQNLKMPLCFRENRLPCSLDYLDRACVGIKWLQEPSLEKTIKSCYFDRKTCTVVGNCPDCHNMGDLQYVM